MIWIQLKINSSVLCRINIPFAYHVPSNPEIIEIYLMPNYRWYLTLQDPQQIFFRFQSENLHEKETVEMYFWITYLDSVHFFLIYMEFFF